MEASPYKGMEVEMEMKDLACNECSHHQSGWLSQVACIETLAKSVEGLG